MTKEYMLNPQIMESKGKIPDRGKRMIGSKELSRIFR